MTHKVTDETRKMVENASGMGLSQEDIAYLLEVRDPKTIRRRYRKELNAGRVKANLQVATRLFDKCKEGDNTAIIWWEKTRAGKSERMELSGPGGGPIPQTYVPGGPELLQDYYAKLAQSDAAAAADAPGADPAAAGDLGRGGPEGDEPGEDPPVSPR